MKTTRHIAAAIVLLLFCLLVGLTRAEEPQGRERVLAVARGLVGTQEATGRNDGPQIEAILHAAGANKGDPYCAAFNFWCYQQAGFARLVPRSAWSPDWVDRPTWTLRNGGRTPLPGDSWGIFFPRRGRVAHTGLVESWGRDVVVTIEANTSPMAEPGSGKDRDGDGIWRKRRLTRQIHSVRSWFPN